ncbi:hypothetical protein GGI12_004053, partial [Dipsacomyces acuminosporus]
MNSFAQFSIGELHKSGALSLPVPTNEGSKTLASYSELKQLQEELEKISARAAARAIQLEHSHTGLKSKLAERNGESLGRKRGK